MGELKQKVVSGAVWLTVERFVSQFFDFALGMVLARLLTPSDYGTVALTAIFFVVARSLSDCGLGVSLIQKKDADDLDFNSVFYASLVLTSCIYAVLFFASPFIADFYHEPMLVSIMRVSGLTLFVFAVNSVQTAEMTRQLRFDLMFKVSLICSIANAAIGISLALLGLGAWALVFSSVLSGGVNVMARWLLIRWRPRLEFSWVRVKSLVSFGWKVSMSDCLDNFFKQLSGMMIGKFYTKADLAFVEKGGGIPQRVLLSIDPAIGGAAYPAFVRMQDDSGRMLASMRKVGQCSLFLVAPAMAFVALKAPDLIRVLFGDQWLPSIPYMRLVCVTCVCWPMIGIHNKVLMAAGHSGVVLFINVIMHAFTVVLIATCLRFSVLTYFTVGCLTSGPLMLILHMLFTRKLIGYRFRYLLQDCLPIAACCACSLAAVYAEALPVHKVLSGMMNSQTVCALLRLFVDGVSLAFAYFAVSWFFRLKPFLECCSIAQGFCSRKFPRLSVRCERMFLFLRRE